MSERIAILDFETTGMSPAHGARAAEVGIVMVENGRIVDRYQNLMNAGQRMPSFITQLTGITTAMLQAAAPAEQVMREAADFVGTAPLVAHNASFDSKFWLDELERAGCAASPAAAPVGSLFACTVLLSRRLYPEAPSHSLGKIVRHLQLPPADKAHRALADAEMTAHLLLRMQADLRSRWHIPDPSHALLSELQVCQRKHLGRWLSNTSARQTQPQLPELVATLAPKAAAARR
ncbi:MULTISPECIES: 3'-5' exonuclease [Comamonas]|jgi:DNA polymerase-3 subunit epsilon|uniref:3'-5' exonuclease n=2 Tax=Comamonas TaxID=283 RepID=A0ABY5ZWR8_9BURK|nr:MULTISPECIES: 3'-5' exonuclease [Comamonas]UXC18428.1 3'-5' exonuclease [Comamonas sp. PR12]